MEKRKKKERKCLSMDETILEELMQQDSLNKQFKLLSTNRSMNSLPTVSGQELLNFLCKQNVSVKTSELCKIAREINSSQADDLSLSFTEKKRAIQRPKYHSWPTHTNQNEKYHVKYHNYGLLEEYDTDSITEDPLEAGIDTKRSWASPSEWNVVEPIMYYHEKNLNKKTVSCPCLFEINENWSEKTHLTGSISMIDLKKLSKIDDDKTVNIDGIINNDFKNKFSASNEANLFVQPCQSDSKKSLKLDQAYNSLFKQNVLELIEEENKETSCTQQQFKIYQGKKDSSIESSLFSSCIDKVDNSSLSLYTEESSGSDSGVGQLSHLLPALNEFDLGVESSVFKKRADVSHFIKIISENIIIFCL